ncbi:MAG: TaqI-like C-terminal specificity domain-containing protein [Candidatus Delongbacteria bacterium]
MSTAAGQISVSQAADMLKVSQATLKNWVKTGLIENKNGFSEEDISEISESISSGKIRRLSCRANKRSSRLSVTGSFYTPENAAIEIIGSYRIIKGAKICDPCCGTGRFLLPIAERYRKNVDIYGYDTDASAVSMVRKKLESLSSRSFLSHADSLKTRENEKYDYIFTNPPWGAHFFAEEKKELKKIYPQSGSTDSLEFFIHKGLKALKTGGVMSYILPESFLFVKRFSKLREYLLRNTKILFVENYGRIFRDVFTRAVRVDIKKEKPSDNHSIKSGSNPELLLQKDLLNEPFCSFNINISESERKLIDKIYLRPHYTLKGKSEWSLGIVTGNNKEFVSSTGSKEHPIPLISGKNIKPYRIEGEMYYLKNDFGRMQQVPKNMIFSKEKLFYRFISDRLVFAYDNSGMMSLNSANVLIPDIPGYPVEAVAAVLNSRLMNFIYKKRFNSLKVLKSYLEMLPFPKGPDRSLIDLLKDKVRLISNCTENETALGDEINSLIYKLYGVKKN